MYKEYLDQGAIMHSTGELRQLYNTIQLKLKLIQIMVKLLRKVVCTDSGCVLEEGRWGGGYYQIKS